MDKYIGLLLDNRYEILEVIGTGGMAVVYRARCRLLNRYVAIKILKDEFASDADFRRRFHTEAQAVAKLQHPNIVSVYDVNRTDNIEYIVMELAEGITLKEYMEKKGALTPGEVLHFAPQIVSGLEHAHNRGIIHRDKAKGRRGDAPYQITYADKRFAAADAVAEGAHQQRGQRGGNGAGGDHGGDKARIGGDGVVEENVEIHVFDGPGKLAHQADEDQADPHAQADFFHEMMFLSYRSGSPFLL